MGMPSETQDDKEVAEYVLGKLREFWQSRFAQQHVRLNDPKLERMPATVLSRRNQGRQQVSGKSAQFVVSI
jgi:hypothetical protein